jgi:hypothetical protein
MMSDPQNDVQPGATANIAANLTDLNVIAEAVVGYRRTLVAGGIPEDIATDMAMLYHETLLAAARAGLGLK